MCTYVRVIVHSRDQELYQGFQRARHKLIITIVQTPIVLLHRLPVTVSSARVEFAWIWSCLWHVGPVDENSQLESCNLKGVKWTPTTRWMLEHASSLYISLYTPTQWIIHSLFRAAFKNNMTTCNEQSTQLQIKVDVLHSYNIVRVQSCCWLVWKLVSTTELKKKF